MGEAVSVASEPGAGVGPVMSDWHPPHIVSSVPTIAIIASFMFCRNPRIGTYARGIQWPTPSYVMLSSR